MKSLFNKIFPLRKGYNKNAFYYSKVFSETKYTQQDLYDISQFLGINIKDLKYIDKELSKEEFIESFCKKFGYKKETVNSAINNFISDTYDKKIHIKYIGNLSFLKE